MDELSEWARRQGARPALIFPGAEVEEVSFAELDAMADAAARWLVGQGFKGGDMVALLLENRTEAVVMCWAARRAGLYYALLNPHLKRPELAHLLADCGARLLVTSRALAATLPPAPMPAAIVDLVPGAGSDANPGALDYQAAVARYAEPGVLPVRPVGREFFYSSGTSGVPKGIKRPLDPAETRGRPQPVQALLDHMLGISQEGAPEAVYLSPAPFYHAAPHQFSMHALARGMTVAMLRRFDAEAALAAMERHRVTHSQWVPTMFVRMLALPEETRRRYDLSAHVRAVHAAAPCPVHVKERMIDWWGRLVVEYYGGSENVGLTYLDCEEWLAHKGSVGRPVGDLRVHICDATGAELPPGEVGTIWFEGFANRFEYHNAPEKTVGVFDHRGWGTYGDIGHVDADGYLYLSDRRTDLILSGGVNVYPAEIESALLRHPWVADAAAFGIPDDEMGEVVQAAVQLRPDGPDERPDAAALLRDCAEHLGRLKCPRALDIVAALPRTETGKLLRRELRARYRGET